MCIRDRYCKSLKKLRCAIQNKRYGMLSSGIVFLHENARFHTARSTVHLIEKFGRDVFDHPPYSSDLTRSDYHLFRHLKQWLQSQRFENYDKLMI